MDQLKLKKKQCPHPNSPEPISSPRPVTPWPRIGHGLFAHRSHLSLLREEESMSNHPELLDMSFQVKDARFCRTCFCSCPLRRTQSPWPHGWSLCPNRPESTQTFWTQRCFCFSPEYLFSAGLKGDQKGNHHFGSAKRRHNQMAVPLNLHRVGPFGG